MISPHCLHLTHNPLGISCFFVFVSEIFGFSFSSNTAMRVDSLCDQGTLTQRHHVAPVGKTVVRLVTKGATTTRRVRARGLQHPPIPTAFCRPTAPSGRFSDVPLRPGDQPRHARPYIRNAMRDSSRQDAPCLFSQASVEQAHETTLHTIPPREIVVALEIVDRIQRVKESE